MARTSESHIGIRAGYAGVMTTQITVRLPEELVAFLDRSVATGRAASRAAVVAVALEREQRRHAAEADATILREGGAADDLDPLVRWAARNLTAEAG